MGKKSLAYIKIPTSNRVATYYGIVKFCFLWNIALYSMVVLLVTIENVGDEMTKNDPSIFLKVLDFYCLILPKKIKFSYVLQVSVSFVYWIGWIVSK